VTARKIALSLALLSAAAIAAPPHELSEDDWFASGLKGELLSVAGITRKEPSTDVVVTIVKFCSEEAFFQVGRVPEQLVPSAAAAAKQSYDHAKIAFWQVCDQREATAYHALVTGLLASAPPDIKKQCTTIEGTRRFYSWMQQCIATETRLRAQR